MTYLKNVRNRSLLPPLQTDTLVGQSGKSVDVRNRNFIELVKRTREMFGVSIAEAHDLIFADDEVRRLIAIRVNRDPECRAQAVRDLCELGEHSRFIWRGDRIIFRHSDGQRE